MVEKILDLASQAVEMAQAAGADAAFVSVTRNRSVKITVRDEKVETVKEAVSKSLSVRIWANGRYGNHRSNDLRLSQLKSFIADAVTLTKAVQPDVHRKITDPVLFQKQYSGDLMMTDNAIVALDREKRLHLAMTQNQSLKGKDKRIISANSSTSDNASESAMVSSNGFQGSEAATSLWIGTEVTLQGDGDKKPEGWMWGGSRHMTQVPNPTEVAQMALDRALGMLGAEKGPSQKTTMIVDPSAAPRLISRLLGAANGRSFSQGRSFWKGKVGKPLLPKWLRIIDDPHIPRGFSSRLYDFEGIASKKMPIIADGALQNIYCDTYYGSKLKMEPTTGRRTNITVSLGEKDLAAHIADAKQAIYVTSWLGGNADSATGDFSFGIRGHLVKNGVITAPVSEMNITGNLLELFSKLSAVGSDPWPYSSLKAPTLRFEGVDFSGA